MTDDRRDANPLRSTLRACRRHFLYAALFSGLVNILYLVPSIYMLQVYDRVVPTRGGATLLVLTLMLAVALGVFAALDTVRMRLLQRASVRLEKMAAPAMLHRVLGTPGATPAQRAQAMRDFDTLRGVLIGPVIVALFDAPWAPIYIVVSWLLHPLLGMLALVAALLLVGLAVASDLASRRGLAEAQARSASSYRGLDFSIAASEVARALGMREALVVRHLIERADAVRIQGEVANSSGGFLAITKFLRLLLQSIALAVGAWLAINQQISAGSIFAASLILGRALQPVEQILGALKNLLSAQAAYRSLDRFCQAPDAARPRTALPAPRGALRAEGLWVNAPGGGAAILENVSFAVEPGEVVALVGPSGAGKSTLMRVLAGALEPSRGEVRLDGARLADWNGDELGRHTGYLPQSPTLFPATVHSNISRFQAFAGGNGGELDARTVHAARLAGAHELILQFPEGYETRLHAREGGGLSAGQRQVVALARALFGDPALVLLDEPNAHLDSQGEQRLLGTIAALRARGATVIVSTHRTGLLQVADKVLVLRDGRLEMFGPRDQIIRSSRQSQEQAAGEEPTRLAGGADGAAGEARDQKRAAE